MSAKARGKKKWVPTNQDNEWNQVDETTSSFDFDESLVEVIPWKWRYFPDNEYKKVSSGGLSRDKNCICLYTIQDKMNNLITGSDQILEVFPKLVAELHIERPKIDGNDRYIYSNGYRELEGKVYEYECDKYDVENDELTYASFKELLDDDPYYKKKIKPYKEGLSTNHFGNELVDKEQISKKGFVVTKPDSFKKNITYRIKFYSSSGCSEKELFTLDSSKFSVSITRNSSFKYFRFAASSHGLTVYFRCDKFNHDYNRKLPLASMDLLHHGQLFTRLEKFLRDNERPVHRNEFKIPDTFDQEEIEEADGFNLELRDYQRRTLSWLYNIETDSNKRILEYIIESDTKPEEMEDDDDDIYESSKLLRFGNTKIFLNVDKNELVFPPFYSSADKQHDVKTIPCNGAVIADDTGSGKTVTVLSLVHKNPFQSVKNIRWEYPEQHNFYIPSRATLVVCPSHLANQWKNEALRCMPNARVCLLTTVMDHAKLSWNDVLLADVVIVSLMFFKNKNYLKRIDEHLKISRNSGYREHLINRRIFNLKMLGRQVFGHETGNVIFERVLWHRLVCDEIHELDVSRRQLPAVSFFVKKIVANFYIGVTGTPSLKYTEDVVKLASYLRTWIPEIHSVAQDFLSNFVRRNEPNLRLPPLTYDNEWVDLTPEELALYHTMKNDRNTALELCNHHQITNDVVDLVGDQALSITDVTKKVQETRLAAMNRTEKNLEQTRYDCDKLAAILKKKGIDLNRTSMTIRDEDLREQFTRYKHYRRSIEYMENELRRLSSQYNFFESVLDTVRKVEEQSCLICLEDIPVDGSFQMTECGHIHCLECTEKVFEQKEPACSACRRPLKRSDVMKMILKVNNEDATVDKSDNDSQTVDHRLFGSKVARLVEFIRKTIKSDPTAKIILFVQFSRLSKLISSSLTTFDVRHTRCGGNVLQRRHAINQFKESDDVKIIMLSAEDSVSGLHLTEANHVIVFHPFMLASEQSAVSYEKQGIARAWRGGQQRPVKVTRFVTRNTIEEELATVRGYKDHVIIENFHDIEAALAPNASK